MAARALIGNVEDLLSLAGLFAVAFVAATVLPAQSEAALVGLLVLGKQSPLLLVIVATIGNVLGSVTNWLLGRWIEHYRHRRWFPVGEQALDRATGWYRRWGRWSLLLVTIAKAGRYIVLTAATLGLL